jgi:superfamily II DNA helicase RecQ
VQVRTFTFRFSERLERFDDRLLQEWLHDKELVQCDSHLVHRGSVPYLVQVAQAMPFSTDAQGKVQDASPKKSSKRRNWREEVDEADWPLATRLVEWRRARAIGLGVPPFLVFNNTQMIEMIKRRPSSLNALGEIHGIGEMTLKKYGTGILEVLKGQGGKGEAHVKV